jgi:5'-3' exonuclease
MERFNGSHVIFCLEGRSWRKDHYAPYKANRAETRAALTQSEQEEDKLFWEAFDTFKDFVTEKTNCTVLQHQQLEADDLIAGWIQSHPDANHVIISTDTDFLQLIAPNVKQYNGVMKQPLRTKEYFDDKGKPLLTKKQRRKNSPRPRMALV